MEFRMITYDHIFEPEKYFAQCHASTLVLAANGDVICAWFGGTYEDHPDVAIWMNRRVGGIWTEPFIVADEEGIPCWNPVLSKNSNGRLFLYYKVGKTPRVWHTMYTYSDDDGLSWSFPKELVEGDIGGRGPVKNKCIILSNGEMLAPASIETDTSWDAFVDRSIDGIVFEKSGLVPIDHTKLTGKGIIQPTLWESQPGQVHMLLRSSEGSIFRSDSDNYGKSWSPAFQTVQPNNNSGIDVVLTEGVLALIHNPVRGNWGARTPVKLSLSEDNGQTWRETIVLDHNEEPKDKLDGEFSYPAIVANGRNLFICYTWKRRTVAFWEVELTQ